MPIDFEDDQLTGFRHDTVLANGIPLHYVRGGSGRPVVLLHGWPSTWWMWRPIMPALARTYDVIAVDLRGFGDSGKPADGYDTLTITEDLRQLFDQLRLGSVRLVGHDMGAVHAYAFAAQHHDRVSHLAYLDEPLPGFGYNQVASLPVFHEPAGGFWFASFNMLADLPTVLTAGREREFLSFLLDQLSFNKAALRPETLDEYVRTFSPPGAMRASMGVYRDIFVTADQVRELAKTPLPMPVLALGGRFGMGEFPLNDMRAVADDVRGGVIELCGHFLPEERPAELLAHLTDLFALPSTQPPAVPDGPAAAPGLGAP